MKLIISIDWLGSKLSEAGSLDDLSKTLAATLPNERPVAPTFQ